MMPTRRRENNRTHGRPMDLMLPSQWEYPWLVRRRELLDRKSSRRRWNRAHQRLRSYIL